MASIQETLIGDVQEETEEKIGTKQGFPHLTAKSGSVEVSCSTLITTYFVFIYL